jgi:peptidoglycan hydrolase CwlO-like protein
LLKKLDQCGFFAKGKIKAQIKEARSKAKPTMDKLTALDKRIEPKRAEIKGLKEKLANPIQ